MNDNTDKITGVEIHLPAYFLTDRDEFDFYSYLPDFRAIEVWERRLMRGHGRRLTIQMADKASFLCVTEYRFPVR